MEFRTFKKLVDEVWVPIEFEDLKFGDHVQAYERGELHSTFTVSGDPFPCKPDGNWGVPIERVFHKMGD